MRPRKVVVLVSDCEQAGSRTRFVLMTRLHCFVRPATEDDLAAVVAEERGKAHFGCVVAVQTKPEPLPAAVTGLLGVVPSLLIAGEWKAAMDAPSSRAVHGDGKGPEGVLDAVRQLLQRRKGPKPATPRPPARLDLRKAVAA